MKKRSSHISVFIYLWIFILIPAFQISANSQKLSFNTLADIESQALTFVKDSDGFIWIGTYVDGLYRFDGKNLVHYTKASNFILSNNVPAIMEDQDGILWFVSAGGGLTRYDKEQNKREHFIHDQNDPTTLSSNSFFWAGKNILVEDDQRNLWIGTIGGGLNRFNKESGLFFHYRHDSSDEQSLSSDNVRAVYMDTKNRIWVGTEQGLNLLNKDNKTFTRIRLERGNHKGSAQKIIMAIYEDSLGTLWVGTENNGLFKYDESQNKFGQFKFDLNDPNSIAYNQISHLSEDELGNLWISHQNKFSILKLKTDKITQVGGDLNDITMSFIDEVTSLVWALTDTGKVLFHNPEGNFFKQYGSNPDDINSLSSEIVISIFEDSEGILWISTIKGFNRYDPVKNEFTHFFHDPTDPSSIPSTADYSPGIFEDKDKVFWIGNSLPSALSVFDRETQKVIKTYYPDPSNPDSLPDAQQINRMIVDSNDPNIMWMSTAKGLVRFNKKIEKFKTFGRDNSWSLFEDEDGFIWISTWGNGIGKFDKQTQTFEYFSHDPKNPDSISDNLLVPLFIDSESRIWIGTENGLNLFDKNNETFKSYKRSDGYPFDAIHSIGEDKNKNLWLGTNAGLVRFNPRTLKARAFTKEDGILSMMFYANNGITSKSGEMWFGGTKGMNSFFPEQIRLNQHLPDIKLTSIKQGGEIVNLNKAPERLSSVTFDWQNNFFEFEFAAFDYISPKKNQYAYKLEGFDKDWFYSGDNNFGRYSGIPPGSYLLKLKGSNNDGVWNEEGTQIEINILPPFWRTIWFYTLIAAIVIGIILIAIFYMVRLNSEVTERKKVEVNLKDSNDKLLMLDKLKDEFLANTSHELRTPLTGIIGLSESLIAGASGPLEQKAKIDLSMIAASGQRLSNLVNDILDFSKLRHKDLTLNRRSVDIRSLTDVVLAISRPIASTKPIVLENRVEKDLPYVLGDENRLQQILFNLVGNAIKFTQEGRVRVTAQMIDKFVEVSVVDTGIGIPQDKHETVFKSFEQVDGSIDREFSGTGLGLSVSKKLVELHGGKIGLSSTPGEGSMFYFTIPISDEKGVDRPEENSMFKVMDLETQVVSPAEFDRNLNTFNLSKDKPNILVVDDEAVNLKVLANHLSLQDYEVTQVTNGIDALKTIEKMEEKGQVFDLVLLDVMMPKMSGYEVCERLRAKFPADKLPVVMLTAKNRAEDLAAGLKSGANDYLTKPFNKTELLARIKNQKDLKDLAKKRQESQDAFLESEKQYRDLFNNLVDVFYRADLDGNLVLVSPSFENVLGYRVEEAIGMKVASQLYVDPHHRETLLDRLEKDGQVEGFETQIKKKDGSIIWVETSSRIYHDEQNNPAGVEGIFRDITRQKQAEQMRDLLATVIEQAAELIIVTDLEGCILYVNPAFEHGTGYAKEEVIGKNPSILKSGKHEDVHYSDLWKTISKGQIWKGRLTNKRKDQSFFEEEATITPVKDDKGNIINYVAIKRDVTKEVRLESQLLQAQKMESIGTLAGGIAHDFNNILSAIMGHTEISLMDSNDENLNQSLNKILKAGNRAKDLVNQILTFSRQTDIKPVPVKVKLIVKEVIKLLRASLPSSIEIRQNVVSNAYIMADPTQIHQILMNLCTNASYAMREKGGALTVELVDVGQQENKSLHGRPLNGKWVKIIVADTGAGMSQQILEKIFDPFYTTKEKGQGTGMGLAVVHGIVNRYKGVINLDSQIGKGSSFEVYLPQFKQEGEMDNQNDDQLLFGSEHLLFIDDEKVQADLGKQLLEKLGYRVDTQTDSEKALELFKQDPDKYDVIITDMTMPKMSGDQLSRKILSIRPDMPIILSTGYNEQISEEKAKEIGVKGYVHKPVVLKEMSKIIRQVLHKD